MCVSYISPTIKYQNVKDGGGAQSVIFSGHTYRQGAEFDRLRDLFKVTEKVTEKATNDSLKTQLDQAKLSIKTKTQALECAKPENKHALKKEIKALVHEVTRLSLGPQASLHKVKEVAKQHATRLFEEVRANRKQALLKEIAQAKKDLAVLQEHLAEARLGRDTARRNYSFDPFDALDALDPLDSFSL
jgi:hypothetical protein